jgi:hypothetical protein
MHNEDIESPGEIFFYQEIFNVLEQKDYVIFVLPNFFSCSKFHFSNSCTITIHGFFNWVLEFLKNPKVIGAKKTTLSI